MSKIGRMMALGMLGGGVAPDISAPTVVITCTQTSPAATTPLNFTFTFSEDVTGFVIGDITVVNGTIGNFAGNGAVYTADITPVGMSIITVNIAGSVCVDGAGNGNTAATQFSFTSTTPFVDAFTRSDGAIGSIWTGATWTISSGVVVNTPTGIEKVINGTMEADSDWANVGTPTTQERSTEQVHAGTYSRKFVANAQVEGIGGVSYAPSLGKWYKNSIWVYGDATNKIAARLSGDVLAFYPGGGDATGAIYPASWTNLKTVFRETSANTYHTPQVFSGLGMSAATGYVDDFSSIALNTNTLFAVTPSVGLTDVTVQVVMTVTPGKTQGGVILNLDSTSSPLNFVIAYLDFTTGFQGHLVKCVNGVYTSLIAAGGITFGATKNLKVTKSGDDYSMYYGTAGSETQIGTTQTVTGMTGTLHGLFSTDPSANFDTFQLSNP